MIELNTRTLKMRATVKLEGRVVDGVTFADVVLIANGVPVYLEEALTRYFLDDTVDITVKVADLPGGGGLSYSDRSDGADL